MSTDTLYGSVEQTTSGDTGSQRGDDTPCASVKECQAGQTDAQKRIDGMDCDQLKVKIDKYVNRERPPGEKGTKGLKFRFPEQINGNCGPGTKRWDTHGDEIVRQQANLQHALAVHQAKGCDPLPEDLQSDAEDYAGRQAPQDSDWLGGAGECIDETAPAQQPVPVPQATGDDAIDHQAAEDTLKNVTAGAAAATILGTVITVIVRILPFLVLAGA